MKSRRLIAVTSCWIVLLTAVSPQRSNAKIQSAEVLLKYVLQLAAATKEQVWPGFDAAKYVFLVPDAKAGIDFFGISPDPQSPNRMILMAFDAREYGLEDGLILSFHEAFHAFERDKDRPGPRWRRENSLLVAEYPEESARNSALFVIESQILFSALQSGNKNDARKRALEFLAVRKLRQNELEARFVEFEKGLESNEGLAEYAGTKTLLRAIELVKQNRASLPLSNLNERDYLAGKYQKLNSITSSGKNSRLRYYYTGSAQGFLLDRFMSDWKSRIQITGAATQDLIEEAVGLSRKPWQSVAATALQRHGYDKILKEEEEAARKKSSEKQALLDSLVNKKGLRLIIDVAAIGSFGQVRGFDPMNVTVIGKEKRIHSRMLKAGEENHYSAEFNQPVIEDLQTRQYLTTIESDEKITIRIDGVLLDITPAEKRFATLILATSKVTLEARNGIVKISPDRIVITLVKD
jgi:hypothetical protein